MRNKRLADIILIALFIGFIGITIFRILIFNNLIVELVSFTIEAALVGGIADWFAVTALFKKPLGFSWHTAIIPKNKEKVVEAIVNVVENELLSSQVIKDKLGQIDIVDKLILYMDRMKTKVSLTNMFTKYSGSVLEKLDIAKISGYTEGVLKRSLKQIDLSIHISNIFEMCIKNGMHEKLLEILAEELIEVVKKERTRILIYSILDTEVKKGMNETRGFKRVFFELSLSLAEGTNSINISEAAESIQKELVEILRGIKNKDNEFYFKLKKFFEEVGERLKIDEKLLTSIENWKIDIIESLQLEKELERLISQIEMEVTNNEVLTKWISDQIDKYWNHFKGDNKSRNLINEAVKETLYKILQSEHYLIGKVAKDTLGAFTDEALNEFIESRAGNDLHWIRINGAMVGAIAGVLVFLFLNLVYEPIIINFFHL
jgi:uncharacterized membrane-anchored protein YjiN (DUF445 family)